MRIIYRVTPEIRKKLQSPFGKLLQGTFSENAKHVSTILGDTKPPRIVTVGDVVSENLCKTEILPQLLVTDNKSMRKQIKPTNYPVDRVTHVENPPGTITEEADTAMREAILSAQRVHIMVDGEEDLLTLIAVLYAPEKTIVLYGQPGEGMVVVEATANKKAEARKILEAMTVRKPK